MRVVYTLIVELSRFLLPIVGLFNASIKDFLKQRKTSFFQLSEWKKHQSNKPVFWLHCASLGEYEMIVPLISDKRIQSTYEVVISFFSKSGYQHAKTDGLVSTKFYLPLDRSSDMNRLVQLINPSVFALVKYDFWLNLLTAINRHQCTTLVVNGMFRDDHFITSTLASAWRNQLKKFTKIYVQNEASANQLKAFHFHNVVLSNDLRFDRVVQLAEATQELPIIKRFVEGATTLILGSSWPEEEYIVLQYMKDFNPNVKLIIAPHDIGADHIAQLQTDFKEFNPVLYSKPDAVSDSRVLILNTIGQLSHAYQYGTIAFIGGAFGKGLHNVLEAAVHGLPIFTGSNIEAFPEAKALKELNVLHPVEKDPRHFIELIADYTESTQRLSDTKQILADWFKNQTGETQKIVSFIASQSIQS